MRSPIRMCSLLLIAILAGSSMTATMEARGAVRTRSQEIRHQILMSPYYGVFDWIDAEQPTRVSVVLRGQVREPSTKSDIEHRIRRIEGISTVVNQIQVLPLSPNDDRIRIATYRAIFQYNGPLFRYAHAVNPSIHIIVDNGRVTLKGVVANKGDRQLAYFAARYVPGVFEVKNELKIEKA
jgi:hyperosmotically inducible periplasmic protein